MKRPRTTPTTESAAAFAAPLLTAFVLFYQFVAPLQIAVGHPSTLMVAAAIFSVAAVAGLLAAAGPPLVRAIVLAVCAAIVIDVTTPIADLFDHAAAETRAPLARDRKRLADIHAIKIALDTYAGRIGPLPEPTKYGENTGPADFWADLWDASAEDGDGDGKPFLDFLADSGVLTSVPVDPLNEAGARGEVRGGKQYVYFVAPANYHYGGGACVDGSRGVYLLAITDLETETQRPPANLPGSGCACLWRQIPNFFQAYFDFVLCGTFAR